MERDIDLWSMYNNLCAYLSVIYTMAGLHELAYAFALGAAVAADMVLLFLSVTV